MNGTAASPSIEPARRVSLLLRKRFEFTIAIARSRLRARYNDRSPVIFARSASMSASTRPSRVSIYSHAMFAIQSCSASETSLFTMRREGVAFAERERSLPGEGSLCQERARDIRAGGKSSYPRS
jgi:hypothetical protein